MSDTKIDTLQLNIESNSSRAYAEIDKLAISLSNLTTTSAKLTVVANRLNKLNTALAGLKSSSSGLSNLTQISNALNNLGGVSSKGLTSTVNALKKIPEVTQQLSPEVLKKFSKQMKELAMVLEPISTRLNAVGNGFRNLANSVSRAKVNQLNKDLKVTNNTAGLLKKTLNFATVVYGLRMLTNGIASSVKSMNDYIENINLFNVSMGEFKDEAREYAEMVQNKMGIDASEWMRGQGVFMSMATGFGLAKDQAYELSKGMTELSYDMSSFYNIPITEALTKMRSALAGEIEPLRALGISLTEAQLKELALSKGITKSVEAMTEAEKAQLRYVAIVEKATNQNLIGDFARTLDSPANAIRILQQRFTVLARTIGSVFIPIIEKVMPYVQAFVTVLTNAISKLATFFKFDIKKYNNTDGWKNTATNVGATADALGDASKKAKEYKKSLQGFDELNIIPAPQEASGGSGASAGGGDLGLDLKSVWDDSIFTQINSQTDGIIAKFQELGNSIKSAFSDNFETIKNVVGLIISVGVGIGAWQIISKLAMGFGTGFGVIKSALETVGIYALYVKDAIVGFFTTASPMFLPMVAVIGAVASVVYTLYTHFDTVVAVVKGFVEKIKLKEKFEEIKNSLAPLLQAISGLGELFDFVGTVLLTILQPAIAIIVGVFNGFIWAVQPIITLITGVIDIFGALGSFLIGIFTGDMNKCGEAINRIWNGIVNIFVGGIGAVIGFVSGFVSGVINWFTNLWDVLVGHSIVPDMVNAIIDWFKNMGTNVINSVKQFATNIINKFKEIWTNVKNWYSSNIAPKFTIAFWVNKFNGFKEGFVQSVKNMLNAGIDMINKFIRWLNSKLRFSWDGLSLMGKQIFPSGSVQLVRIPEITQRFADGGFIEDGLFTMNKGEIAGEFSNGKSVVANNQQIIAGISQGVYEAMMRANGNGKEVNINATFQVDGKEIGKSFVKYHNGVVQQTGLSPLMI